MQISIHSPHTRGDSINFQKSNRIQGSLYNKLIIPHLFQTLKPVFMAQSSPNGVRNPLGSHDSYTFARLFKGRIASLHDLAGYALRQMLGIDANLIIFKAAGCGNFRFTLNIHELEQLPRGGFAQLAVMLKDD